MSRQSQNVRSSSIDNVARLEQMHELMEQVLEIEKEQAPNADAVRRVQHIIEDAETIVEAGRGQMEMLIDGQIFYTGQNVLKGAVKHLDTNLMPFNLDDYVMGIENYLLKSRNSSSEINWATLANETFVLFRSAPRFNFKLGTFQLDPPPKEEKVAKDRAKKTEKTEKAVVQAIDTNEPEKKVKQYGEHILKCLARFYKANQRNPISYFEFIVDPNNFWRTVHNAYHFSHLVKDGKVIMSLDENKLPVIEPVRKSNDESQTSQQQTKLRSQFNFRMTPHEYREIILAFNITSAAIPPM